MGRKKKNCLLKKMSKGSIEPSSTVSEENLNLIIAVKDILKNASYDGLSRGLREAIRTIERGTAWLCILAESCDSNFYNEIIEALCKENKVNVIRVNSANDLGTWCGLGKIDSEGNVKKVVKCSCAVVTDIREQSKSLEILEKYIKSNS